MFIHMSTIDLSPGEKYLANCSSHEPSNPRGTHRVVLNVFDVRTGKIMKGFNERADEFAFGETGGFTGVSWPVFRPQPPSLLCPEKEEEILKNLKKYSGKYEIEDQDISVLTGPERTMNIWVNI
ncbi:putative eukaryotic translation initiation factor 3 subunit B [Helianthus annuus]|uniref:Eukaryotic translation initiation factor 3 subunit B n=1 Tax=Helianthus annuus TaxID=4232 RepID=A0A9K3ND36_HELAN|nr:putative eukaryotic translation initiation factor 3 subunit B [Helianthus annuus]KAF5795860.1 putative eukaryotic translation initiation factor 3 subunit B [Helianthus annuus]KAJ0539307.1 putative eukaryotic translation initiation factor 3 subunit B [Helianthus annuus]KAJ0547419.1 putative eukaryotic translation initiation factor 3 subunit B [Helianthus annuus]KAJ0553967.1 putative eukaryotic translation initiation factor 3 subunit B [Helianthus annuus]